MTAKRPLWECPACGQAFVTRNMSHSCGRHTLDEHFTGKDPQLRGVFDALVEAARAHGAVHVYAQKTRIVFQTRGRFVAVTPRRRHLGGHIWLKRARTHPRVHRTEALLDRDFVHHFRISRIEDHDAGFQDLLREAYLVGSQEPAPGRRPPPAENRLNPEETSMQGKPTAATIDEYLAGLPADQRAALEKLRRTIRAAAPGAQECISYSLPAFRLRGRPLVAFGAAAKHCSFYPMSGDFLTAFADELVDFETSKGTIRFQPSKPIPAALVRKLVRARIAETAA